MTLQAAEALTLKIGNGGDPESFALIANITSLRMEVENQAVESQDIQSNGWRQQLEGAGKQRVTLQLEGLFSDTTAEETLRTQAFAHSTVNYQMDYGNGDQLSGPFQVARYGRRGTYAEGAEAFSLQLVSSGAVTFTTA